MKKLLILATMLSFGAFAQTVDVGDQKSATIEAFVNVDSALSIEAGSPMDFGTLVAGESEGERQADQTGNFMIEKDADRTITIEIPHGFVLKEQEAGADKVDGAQINVHDLSFALYGDNSDLENRSGDSANQTGASISGYGLTSGSVLGVLNGYIQMDDATVAGSYKGSFEVTTQYE